MSISAIYATPELRMRAASQPLAWGGEQKLLIGDLRRPEELFGPQKIGETAQPGFSQVMTSAVSKTAELGHASEAKADAFARGAFDDLHGSMISAKEAEISLKLVGTVRSKLLDAFHELWRTNV
ncbi:MAG: hypothetical protein EXR75_11065 [Myxococcales bacterium]|nr:hypothetical protein [Myxococcales bacterium]